MWVKGSPLQFIIDNGNQNNLISAEVMKQLGLPTIPHPQPYNIRWLLLASLIKTIINPKINKLIKYSKLGICA